MYSGKFPCSLIIIKSKKRFSSTTDYSVHICTQINIDPVHFTFSPENCHFCTEFNSDFIVQFILVRFVIVTKGNRI